MNITEVEELEKVEEFSMDWKGKTVKFSAKAASLTPAFLTSVNDRREFGKAVADVVTEWDVTSDNNGTLWPLTEEALNRLPIPFLDALLGRIIESWTGDKKKQKTSPSQSEAAAS